MAADLSTPTRYREIEVAGPPLELGRQIGEAARDQVRGFCQVALERTQKSVNVSREAALALATECIPLAAEYRADLVEELRGTAEAAGVTLEELMLLQVRNQLRDEEDAGCTSLAVREDPLASHDDLLAQNWDNDTALDEFTIVLTRRPEGKPANMTLTQAGLIGYIGMNDAGVGLCLNTLPAPSRRLGVPHYFTVREILEARGLEDCVKAVDRAQRAIPANIMLAAPEGPADLEVTLDGVRVLRDAANQQVTHTNHCLHPDLTAVNQDFPELIESHPRKRRIDELLKSRSPCVTVADVQTALSDHQNHPRSICRHSSDDERTGFWETVFSVVMQPGQGQMHVSRGTPCSRPYESYQLARN